MKIVSLFSGIGAYEKALKNIGIDIELINYCELDKVKSKAYSLLHNVSEEKNLFDVTQIDTSKIDDFEMLVYSPPCQAFSVAGKKQGLNDIRGTLFFNALKVIRDKQPKYCVMENVDNLPNKFTDEFNEMLRQLDVVGYNNYWKIINAKDFIPQNRSRVFIVSIRKDIDTRNFEFPTGNCTLKWSDIINPYDTRPLTARQQRMIDYVKGINNADEIKIEGIPQFENAVITLRQSGLRFQNNREYPTITAYYGKGGGNFTIMAYKNHIGGITPRNCFRLMGFDYADSDLLTKNGFSVSSQYIMAGDSVCVPVLGSIFTNLIAQKQSLEKAI
jgi:DNA (cytosine-5)-methyltransferase 1